MLESRAGTPCCRFVEVQLCVELSGRVILQVIDPPGFCVAPVPLPVTTTLKVFVPPRVAAVLVMVPKVALKVETLKVMLLESVAT